MARILALTKASSLLISIVGTCDGDRPPKITGKTNLSLPSSISEGGTGNGWARSTIAKAAESSAGKPELSASFFRNQLARAVQDKGHFRCAALPHRLQRKSLAGVQTRDDLLLPCIDGVRFGMTGTAMAIKKPRQPTLSHMGRLIRFQYFADRTRGRVERKAA
jgi:hypothetical protein